MLRTKSVWSPIDRKHDGLRILATRFRGRALPASRHDVWMANLGPSERPLAAGSGGSLTKPWRKEVWRAREGPRRNPCNRGGERTVTRIGKALIARRIGESMEGDSATPAI